MTGAGPALPLVTIAEAQSFVRIEGGEEEALVAGFIRTASALCESFIGQVVIARDFVCEIPLSAAWERLPVTPVRAILEVQQVDAAGGAATLPSGAYAVDLDSSGDGWVRVLRSESAGRVRVIGRAGIADDQNGIPEPLRQGVLRLVAHLFAVRDGPDGDPPAAVTALWRPYRRMRMA